MAKLGDICEILNGYAFKSEKYVNDGIRVIRITNVQKGYIEDTEPKFYPIEYSDELSKYRLKNGDLLISLTGNVGRVAILTNNFLPAALNQRVACLRLRTTEILKQYLFHVLNSDYFEQMCIMASNGIAQKNLSTEWLKGFEIPDFSINKQHQIVANLDKVTRLIDLCNSILEKLDLLVKARFVEMFGDIYTNACNFPICSLSDYIVFITSGSRGWSKYCVDDGKEWFITIKNVKDCRISTNNMQPVNAPDNMETKRTKVEEGDLLISITADLGRTGVVTREIAEHGAYINQHLTCVRLDQSKLVPLFVSYFMESASGKPQFESKNQTGVKAGLNFDSIKSLKLLIPPIALQKQFTSFVEQTEKTKLKVKQALEKAEMLKKALMQEYLG